MESYDVKELAVLLERREALRRKGALLDARVRALEAACNLERAKVHVLELQLLVPADGDRRPKPRPHGAAVELGDEQGDEDEGGEQGDDDGGDVPADDDGCDVPADDDEEEEEEPQAAARTVRVALGTFASLEAADLTVRRAERACGRRLRRVQTGHGANSTVAVYECAGGCPWERVRYKVRIRANGSAKLVESHSEHGDTCSPLPRSDTRVLLADAGVKATLAAAPSLASKGLRALAAGRSSHLSGSSASRVRAQLVRKERISEDDSVRRLVPALKQVAQQSPGTVALVRLHVEPHGERVVRITSRYVVDAAGAGGEVDGHVQVTVEDTHAGTPIAGRLRSAALAPGSSRAIWEACIDVASLDYGRLLVRLAGGYMNLVTRLAGKQIQLAMNYCEIETVEAWADVLDVASSAIPALHERLTTLLTDRFTGTDAHIAGRRERFVHADCKLHLLHNIIDNAGKLEDENEYWDLAGARNANEYRVKRAAFAAKYAKQMAYLESSTSPERWVFGVMADAGIYTGGVRSSMSEIQFATDKRDGARNRGGLFLIGAFLAKQAQVIAEVRRLVAAWESEGLLLGPAAGELLQGAIERAAEYVVTEVVGRDELGRPTRGLVSYANPGGAAVEQAEVDVLCKERSVARRAEVVPGRPGGTGFCSRCHQPDGAGIMCSHLARFMLEKVQTKDTPVDWARHVHHSNVISNIKAALEAVGVPPVLVLDSLGDGDAIAPLVGKAPPGRPPKPKGKRGPKVKADNKRIKSRGEAARTEALKEAKGRAASSSAGRDGGE
jgi:hypothetical protein